MTTPGPTTRSTPAATAPTPPTVRPRHRRVTTALGNYVIAAEDGALTGIWREAQSHYPSPARLGDPAADDDPLLREASVQLSDYLTGDREDFDLPLAPRGTPFQQQVWDHLRRIGRGGTTTYGQIAHALDRPRAAQAVGAAVGSNPLSIVVPCHRVVAADGALTGYAGGVGTKRALLELEGVLPSPAPGT